MIPALLLQINLIMTQIRAVQAELAQQGVYVNVDANPAVEALERSIN